MNSIKAEWIVAIVELASDEPLIEAAYVFGSRAKNKARADSDLDLAFIISGQNNDERFANWIFEKQRWQERLERSIAVDIDMECALSDDNVVMPAVLHHGIQIYPAQNAFHDIA
jgi:predicted nucleotidyltransferase